jgi:cytochrome c oxidase cbb3-type subunit 1
METLVMRAGGWLVVALLAFFALAYSADAGFAVHMGIVMLAALITLVVTLRGADYGAIARGVLRVPADQSKYDDDPIRWGVIATVFWGSRVSSPGSISRFSWLSRRSTSA